MSHVSKAEQRALVQWAQRAAKRGTKQRRDHADVVNFRACMDRVRAAVHDREGLERMRRQMGIFEFNDAAGVIEAAYERALVGVTRPQFMRHTTAADTVQLLKAARTFQTHSGLLVDTCAKKATQRRSELSSVQLVVLIINAFRLVEADTHGRSSTLRGSSKTYKAAKHRGLPSWVGFLKGGNSVAGHEEDGLSMSKSTAYRLVLTLIGELGQRCVESSSTGEVSNTPLGGLTDRQVLGLVELLLKLPVRPETNRLVVHLQREICERCMAVPDLLDPAQNKPSQGNSDPKGKKGVSIYTAVRCAMLCVKHQNHDWPFLKFVATTAPVYRDQLQPRDITGLLLAYATMVNAVAEASVEQRIAAEHTSSSAEWSHVHGWEARQKRVNDAARHVVQEMDLWHTFTELGTYLISSSQRFSMDEASEVLRAFHLSRIGHDVLREELEGALRMRQFYR